LFLDDPALFDHFPEYSPDKEIGDRPPTPTHEICIAGEDPAKRRNFCPQYLSYIMSSVTMWVFFYLF
jgi:hypothetical protein